MADKKKDDFGKKMEAAAQQIKDNVTLNVILTYFQILSNEDLLNQLESQIPLLHKPENADRLEQLKKQLVGKEAKKRRDRLKDKPWFPQEWMPQP